MQPERIRPRPSTSHHHRLQWDRLESQVDLSDSTSASASHPLAEGLQNYYARLQAAALPTTRPASAQSSPIALGPPYIQRPGPSLETGRYPHLDMVAQMFQGHRQYETAKDQRVTAKVGETGRDHRFYLPYSPGPGSAVVSQAAAGPSAAWGTGTLRPSSGLAAVSPEVAAAADAAAEYFATHANLPREMPAWTSRGPLTVDPNRHNYHRRKVYRVREDPTSSDALTGEGARYITTSGTAYGSRREAWEPPSCAGRTAWNRNESSPGIIGPHPLTRAPFPLPSTWLSMSRSQYGDTRPATEYSVPYLQLQTGAPPRRFDTLTAIPGKGEPPAAPRVERKLAVDTGDRRHQVPLGDPTAPRCAPPCHPPTTRRVFYRAARNAGQQMEVPPESAPAF